MDQKKKQYGNKIERTGYFKGLGETDAKYLKSTTTNPDSRHIMRVTLNQAEQAAKTVEL
jgi:DNA gyrase/topoisomerase IV subunit B